MDDGEGGVGGVSVGRVVELLTVLRGGDAGLVDVVVGELLGEDVVVLVGLLLGVSGVLSAALDGLGVVSGVSGEVLLQRLALGG